MYNAWIKTGPHNTEADEQYVFFITKAQQYEFEMRNLISTSDTSLHVYHHRKKEAIQCIENLKEILKEVKKLNKNNPLVYFLKERNWLESEIIDEVGRYNARHKKGSIDTKADEAYGVFKVKSRQYENEMRMLKERAIEYVEDLRGSLKYVQNLNNPLASWSLKM